VKDEGNTPDARGRNERRACRPGMFVPERVCGSRVAANAFGMERIGKRTEAARV